MIEIFLRFQKAKDKTSSKRLSHYVYRPPTNPVGVNDVAKLVQRERKSKDYPQNIVKLNRQSLYDNVNDDVDK